MKIKTRTIIISVFNALMPVMLKKIWNIKINLLKENWKNNDLRGVVLYEIKKEISGNISKLWWVMFEFVQ
jgi:hypothetical protein